MPLILKHLDLLKRQFNTVPHVLSIRQSRSQSAHFNTAEATFSIYLIQEGKVLRGGEVINSPCVVVQKPGSFLHGLDHSREKTAFVYRVDDWEYFKESGLTKKECWAVQDVAAVESKLNKLRSYLENKDDFGNADHIDLMVVSLLMSSLIEPLEKAGDEIGTKILMVRDYLVRNYAEKIDFEHLSHEHGFTQITFRRHWLRLIKETPGRYLNYLRLKRACHLLAGNEMRIAEISHEVGFDDALYFSRIFKKRIGLTPSEYRNSYSFS